jgi:hypothetical protein
MASLLVRLLEKGSAISLSILQQGRTLDSVAEARRCDRRGICCGCRGFVQDLF